MDSKFRKNVHCISILDMINFIPCLLLKLILDLRREGVKNDPLWMLDAAGVLMFFRQRSARFFGEALDKRVFQSGPVLRQRVSPGVSSVEERGPLCG